MVDVFSATPLLAKPDWVKEAEAVCDPDQQRPHDTAVRRRWQARVGFQNVLITTIVLAPYRIQEVYANPTSGTSCSILLWYFSLSTYLFRCWLRSRSGGAPSFWSARDTPIDAQEDACHEFRWLVGLQLLWASSGQFWFFMHGSMNYITPSTLMLMAIHVPRPLYLGLLVPLNACALFFHYRSMGSSTLAAFSQCALQALAVAAVWLARERAESELYHSSLASERDRLAGIGRRLWAEAQQASFQGMLDSVFDASCLCNGNGEIVSSTPQMDDLLLGSSRKSNTENPGSLVGQRLQSFARGNAEEVRIESFISEAARSSMARRIHLALQRREPSAAGATGEHRRVLEVTASGIAAPAAPESMVAAPTLAATKAGALVYIGFTVAPGTEMVIEDLGEESHLENPTLDDVKKAVCSQPRSEIGAPETIAAPLPTHALEGSSIAREDRTHDGGNSPAAARDGRWQQAPSLCSAPPILESASLPLPVVPLPVHCNGPDGSDCLPATSAVRVEGRGAPLTADAVELGQRVLCYDHLSGGLKYVEVVEASVHHDNVEPDLVEVILEDGTEMQMTCDHPVFAQDVSLAGSRGGIPKSERPVRAVDLEPKKHQLLVLKVSPLAVRTVRRPPSLPEGEVPPTVVSISVRQPQRHSLLVAPSIGDMELQSVAVASASLATAAEMLPHEVRLKNTFLELSEEFAEASDSEEVLENAEPTAPLMFRRRYRRSRSEPPLHLDLPCSKSSDRTTRSSVSTLVSSCGGSSAASYVSSKASAHSGESGTIVVVGKGIEDRRVRGWTCSASTRLSPVMRAKELGLKSLGSLGHEGGWCYPCLMECWHNSDRPCKFGIACSRCHEPHSRRQFKKARFTKPRTNLHVPLASIARGGC
mmetsp:Transcript_61200/g.154505  ORF Transcript_61200/g.154505 Transcript_61200/m.154505 type:complete len:878 (+) Transcript_61200:69-2702(+)